MEVRWLGWAGAEYAHDGEAVVVDPLGDPAATFAAFRRRGRRRAAAGRGPPAEGALAGLVSHLHRDHTDAAALAAALLPGAAVHQPQPLGDANPALAQAEHELAQAGLPRRAVRSGSPSPSVRSAAPRCPPSTASATLRSPGWSRPAKRASCTSATPSSTARGGRWRAAPDRSTWCSRR